MQTICVTVAHLLMMQSTVYDYYIPDNYPKDHDLRILLAAFVKNKNVPSTIISHVFPFKTLNNLPLLHFAKSRSFGKGEFILKINQ